MRQAAIFLAVAMLSAVPARAAPGASAQEEKEAASALLRFSIVDEQGALIPGRLTVVRKGELVELSAEGESGHLAVRKNVAYTLTGRGAVRLPPGPVRTFASRGLEWSLASTELVLEAGRDYEWRAVLRHELDTRGWISGDFHLHTLTHSGHGDADLRERVISLIGEGLEFAVATDHNHNTDYAPALEELRATDRLRAVTGNEVTTPIGHFNAFPLDPGRAPVDTSGDPAALFELIRSESNPYGVLPVIQLNHPRMARIDYFGRLGLDPVTGSPSDERFSWNFDTLEVFNSNAGWGCYDAEVEAVKAGSSMHSVLGDWFNLLDLGYSFRAVGNSDSHTVHVEFAGYPRNFIASKTDDPSAIDPREVADALRAGEVFTTLGPFVEFTVNGERSGKQVRLDGGEVELWIRVQAASWIDCDRVLVLVNGDVAEEIPVPQERAPLRLHVRRSLKLSGDSWIALMIEGDDPLEPVLSRSYWPDRPARVVRPLALTNPVWIDFDGDEDWSSPWVQALGAVRTLRKQKTFEPSALEGRPIRQLKWMALATIDEESPHARELLTSLLGHGDRGVRLAALRAAERLGEPALVDALRANEARKDLDPYERLATARALGACGDPQEKTQRQIDHLVAYMRGFPEAAQRYRDELELLLPPPVASWEVACAGEASEPEEQLSWHSVSAPADGNLSLLDVCAENEGRFRMARTKLSAPSSRSVAFAAGADAPFRIWLNGALVHMQAQAERASPFQVIGSMSLPAGESRLVVQVQPRGESMRSCGFFLRILDAEVAAEVAGGSVLEPSSGEPER